MITRFRRGIDGRMHEDDNGEWVRYREATSPAALDRPCRHAYPHDGPCEAEAASPAALDEPTWWSWDTEDDDSWLAEFGGEDIRAIVRERNRLLAEARRAEAASPAALDVDPSTALAHWLCHGPEDKHTGDSMPCLPHYRMAHDFAARLTKQEDRHG